MRWHIPIAALILGGSLIYAVYLHTERTRYYFFPNAVMAVGDKLNGKVFLRTTRDALTNSVVE